MTPGDRPGNLSGDTPADKPGDSGLQPAGRHAAGLQSARQQSARPQSASPQSATPTAGRPARKRPVRHRARAPNARPPTSAGPDAGNKGPSPLAAADIVVVKVGSSLLVDPGKGDVRGEWLNALADDLADLHRAGKRVLVVSSGAIGLGRETLKFRPGRLRLEESQAAASIGQIRLAHRWQDALARHGITVAQILLTLGDTEDRRRYLNARATLDTLWRLGAIPVVNENDTVATSEIRYGDNDRLAARVAQMMVADCLVLLSDVDGLYDGDPRRKKTAKLVPWVQEVTPEIEAMAGVKKTEYGSGGMRTKLLAARIASAAGCTMAIARGIEPHPIRRMLEGAPCTWFAAEETDHTARKSWIAGSLQPLGALVVDAGARKALGKGRSLLPAGVTAVTGEFDRGDPVIVADADGWELGRGLSAYSAEDARTIAGHRSREITRLLGYRGRDEIIHRDNLVMHSGGPWALLPPELRTAALADEIARREAEEQAAEEQAAEEQAAGEQAADEQAADE